MAKKKESGWSQEDRVGLWTNYKYNKDLAKLPNKTKEEKKAYKKAKASAMAKFNKAYPIEGSLYAKAQEATNNGQDLPGEKPGFTGRNLVKRLEKKKKEEERIKREI